MDIANYLSELLGRHGKVSVPGLGLFTQVRVNGYYNDAEGQFYPPGFQLQFNPEPVEGDDILVQYIAEKKKISLASSKYFTEKYITGLKQELATTEVVFANLGWFFMDQDQVAFKPREKYGDSPDYYGYAPIAIKKLNQESGQPASTQPTAEPLPEEPVSAEEPIFVEPVSPEPVFVEESVFVEPVLEEPVTEPAVHEEPVSAQPKAIAEPQQPQEYINYEEPEVKRSSNVWVIVVIVAVILAAAAFGLYQYNPALFGSNKPGAKPAAEQPQTQPATTADSLDTDTNKTTAPATDSPSKAISRPDTALNKPVAPAPVSNIDTAATQYVIFAGSFKKQATCDLAIKNYKSIGIDARVLSGPNTGKLIKVIIGSFATYKEGETLRLKLVKSGKLRKDSYTQIINQKK